MDVFLVKHFVPTDRMPDNERIKALEDHKSRHSIKAELEGKTGGLVFEFFFSSHLTNITIERVKEHNNAL